MVRDRFDDAYTPGKGRGRGLGLDFGLVIRYGAAAMGAVLIVTGLVLALNVFGLIRDIIESPDTFVANLEAWTTDEADVPAAVTAPPVEPTPAVAVETAPEVPPAAPEGKSDDASAVDDVSAAEEGLRTPEEVIEELKTLRNEARGAATNQATRKNSEFDNLFGEILELIREGGMGRIAGATFIFLFTALLARIPILLIRVGVQLLSASAKVKIPNAG